MRYCPKCGAGIFNSNLPDCPICNANLAEELAVESYFEKPQLSTLWAKILCVIMAVDAIWIMIEGFLTIRLDSGYFWQKYELHAQDIESMENFLGFGAFIIGAFSALGIYGLITYKKVGPRFICITHALYISTYLMYIVNMMEEPIYSLIGGIHIKILLHVAVHAILLIINYLYFKKRKNVYDGVF